MNDVTLEQTEARNALMSALDRYNQVVLGVVDEGELVELREDQLEAIEILHMPCID